jgi:hypothetical protein
MTQGIKKPTVRPLIGDTIQGEQGNQPVLFSSGDVFPELPFLPDARAVGRCAFVLNNELWRSDGVELHKLSGGGAGRLVVLQPGVGSADYNKGLLAEAFASGDRVIRVQAGATPEPFYVRGNIPLDQPIALLDLTGVRIMLAQAASDAERTLLVINGSSYGGEADGLTIIGGHIDGNFAENGLPTITFDIGTTIQSGTHLAFSHRFLPGSLSIATSAGTITDRISDHAAVLNGTAVGNVVYGGGYPVLGPGYIDFNASCPTISGTQTVTYLQAVDPYDCAFWVRAEKVTIRGATIDGFVSFCILGNECSGMKVMDCDLRGAHTGAVFAYPSLPGTMEDVLVYSCDVDFSNGWIGDFPDNMTNSSAGLQLYSAGGLYLCDRGRFILNRVKGPTNLPVWSEYPQCLNIRGTNAVVAFNYTEGGSQGFSEGQRGSLIAYNTIDKLSGQLKWGFEPAGQDLRYIGNTVGSPEWPCDQGIVGTGADTSRIECAHNTIHSSNVGINIGLNAGSLHSVITHNTIYLYGHGSAGNAGYGFFANDDCRGSVWAHNTVIWKGVDLPYNSTLLTWISPQTTSGDGRITLESNNGVDLLFMFQVENSGPVIKNLFARNNRAFGANFRDYLNWTGLVGEQPNLGDQVQNLNLLCPDGRIVSLVDQKTQQKEFHGPTIDPNGNSSYVAGPGSLLASTLGKLWVKKFGQGSTGWKVVAVNNPVGFDPVPDVLFEFFGQLPPEVTFTGSASPSTVADWEGLSRVTRAGEARFRGLNRTENLLLSLNNTLIGTPFWFTRAGGATATVINDEEADCSLPSANVGTYLGQSSGLIAPPTGGVIVFSIELRGTPGETVRIALIDFNNGPNAQQLVTLTSGWVRYAVVFTQVNNNAPVEARTGRNIDATGPFGTAAGFQARRPQVGIITGRALIGPDPYLAVSQGFPITYGALVPGVKYLIQKSANTINGSTGVVTESTGADIATPYGLEISVTGETARITGSRFSDLQLTATGRFTGMIVIQNPLGSPSGHTAIALSDGTLNNLIRLELTSSTNLRLTVVNAGVTVATLNAALTANALVKAAFAVGANDFALCVNAGAVTRAGSGTPPLSALSQIDLGNLPTGGAQWAGIIKQLQFHLNVASPTDAQLQTITT